MTWGTMKVMTIRIAEEASGDNVPVVVLGLALSLEAVYTVHVLCLVVSPVDEEGVGTQPLEGVEGEGDLRDQDPLSTKSPLKR